MLSARCPVFLAHVLEEVAVMLRVLDKEEEGGSVVVLKNRDIVVKQSELRSFLDFEHVVGSGVIHVVGRSGDQCAENFQGSKLAFFDYVLLGEDEPQILYDVSSVTVVVVRVLAVRGLETKSKVLEVVFGELRED